VSEEEDEGAVLDDIACKGISVSAWVCRARCSGLRHFVVFRCEAVRLEKCQLTTFYARDRQYILVLALSAKNAWWRDERSRFTPY
jgi:hypothetical protein